MLAPLMLFLLLSAPLPNAVNEWDHFEKPVRVLAPVDLLILSAENNWKPDSEIRGGNYIWALDPFQDRLFYFAHMHEVLVRAGDFCRAGSAVGTVGRTGKNAYPAGSPTHLHLMVLSVKSGRLIPFDYLSYLAKITLFPPHNVQ